MLIWLVSPVITDLDNLMLFKIPEEREIYQAISQLGPNNAPGPMT
jgi:hypothetical protein